MTNEGQTDRHFSNESGSLESQYEELLKSALRLWRSNAHSARTALCSAVLALSGTGTMVSVIPRPVPRHQRLDTRRSPLRASQPKKIINKKPSLASTYISSPFLLSPSTIVRRGVIQMQSLKKYFAESRNHSMKRSDPGAESGNRMTFKVFTVHHLSPCVNPLDIVIETLQCRLRHDWMCTRSSGLHGHVQSRECHKKNMSCGDEHGRPTKITFALLKRPRVATTSRRMNCRRTGQLQWM